MKKLNTFFAIALMGALVSLSGSAEEPTHPRVAELEQNLSSQAHAYLASRFPGMPFLVTVKVDPLFRNERGASGVKGEQLPYFDLSSEEIVDEWDDPGNSLVQLQRRVRKTVVNVSVPNQLPESEALEIRESIVTFLHLNGARDEVYINRRNWKTHSIEWLDVSLIAAGLMLFLAGLLWINRASSTKIAKALEESSRKSAPAPAAQTIQSGGGGGDKDSHRSADLQMHDPVKLKDLAVRTIDTLCGTKGFPSYLDVFELNEMAKRNPAALGALLVEFPSTIQEKLFAYSVEDSWLKALNEPGVLDFESLMVLRKLLRNKHAEDEAAWSALILSVWRLNNQQRLAYLQQLTKEEAISVMKCLPKGMALGTARKLFPGNWAQVLDTSTNKPLPVNRCEDLCRSAQAVVSLRNLSMLSQYRDELEIQNHLNVSDPYEEREIYQVLPKDGRIAQTRPPFFKVFDADEDTRREVCAAFPVDQWAKALADMKASDRLKIEAFFSEKQQFLYSDTQRRVTTETVQDREEIGRVRTQIAFYLQGLERSREKAKPSEGPQEPVSDANNLQQAA